MLLETCIIVHILFRHPAEVGPVRTTASVCQCTKKTITSVSAKGSGEKTANTVRLQEYGGTFALAGCVLISVEWSLAATDEERNVDISLSLALSQLVLPEQSSFNYVTLASMESFQQLQTKERLKIN